MKLSKYTALTVGGVAGTIAGFESTEAALVITQSGVQLVNNLTTVPTTIIDLNGDNVDDVQITVQTASILDAQGQNGAILAGTIGPQSFFYPTALQASNWVNGLQNFSGGTQGAPMNTFATLANGTGGPLAPGVGAWMDDPNPVTAFLGVQFQASGNTHYGWVHITWDPNADTATILSYAYESDPGQAAKVPEPSTLALLGLGAAGLAARRRRKG